MMIPKGHQTVMPYLMLEDAVKFFDFAEAVFGSETTHRTVHESGMLQHGEIQIGGSTIMFSNSRDEWKPATANMFVSVDDADAVIAEHDQHLVVAERARGRHVRTSVPDEHAAGPDGAVADAVVVEPLVAHGRAQDVEVSGHELRAHPGREGAAAGEAEAAVEDDVVPDVLLGAMAPMLALFDALASGLILKSGEFQTLYQEAGEAPRFRHSNAGLALESNISPQARAGLEQRGHKVIKSFGAFGGFQGILFDRAHGVMMGGSDPRKDGLAIGY